jgi:hypothetical protein
MDLTEIHTPGILHGDVSSRGSFLGFQRMLSASLSCDCRLRLYFYMIVLLLIVSRRLQNPRWLTGQIGVLSLNMALAIIFPGESSEIQRAKSMRTSVDNALRRRMKTCRVSCKIVFLAEPSGVVFAVNFRTLIRSKVLYPMVFAEHVR